MTQSTNVNFRMDANLKKEMENVLNQLGISTTTAFLMYAKTIVRQQRIPFTLDLNERPNALTLKAMDDALEHKNVQGPYDSVEDLMEALHAKD